MNRKLGASTLKLWVGRRAVQTLAHEYIAVGDSGPTSSKQTVLLLHGLLGNKKNLRSFAKLLSREFPDDWQVLLMDLRGHGATPQMNKRTQLMGTHDGSNQTAESAPMLYLAAEDIAHTCNILGAPPPEIVCGHSMGGKVALAYLHSCLRGSFNGNAGYFALHGSRWAPFSTWTLDSVPTCVDRRAAEEVSNKESVASVLAAVSRVATGAQPPTAMSSKASLASALVAEGCSPEVAAWMTTNVEPVPSGEGLRFVFDLPTCEALFASYSELNFLPLVARLANLNSAEKTGSGLCGGGDVEVVPPMCFLDMVRADRNVAAWPDEVVAAIESACTPRSSSAVDRGDSRFHLLRESGHNVHIDNPLGLMELMKPTLERLA